MARIRDESNGGVSVAEPTTREKLSFAREQLGPGGVFVLVVFIIGFLIMLASISFVCYLAWDAIL